MSLLPKLNIPIRLYQIKDLKYVHHNVILHPCVQRLRKINQFGLIPSYDRLTHSIGVAVLARKTIEKLSPRNTHVAKLAEYAGLFHDIGHGPFSHLFDDVIVKFVTKSTVSPPPTLLDSLHIFKMNHEFRSLLLVSIVLSPHLNKDDIKVIQKMISPKQNLIDSNIYKPWCYQVINNPTPRELDVDRLYYLWVDQHVVEKHYGLTIPTELKICEHPEKIIEETSLDIHQKNWHVPSKFNNRSWELRQYLHNCFYKNQVYYKYTSNKIEHVFLNEVHMEFIEMKDIQKWCNYTDDAVINSTFF